MRKALLALGTLLALVIPTACSPSPHDSGPCTHHYFSVGLAVVDSLGNVASRMRMDEDICALSPDGYVISNTASQEQNNIGFYRFIDGGNLEEHPANDGFGPTGNWIPDRIIEVHWNMDLLYGFAGHGFRSGVGNCTLRMDIVSFLTDFQVKWYQGWCSQLASRMGG